MKAIDPVMLMQLYQIDPVRDPRWAVFLKRHPRASVFHTPGWLEALCRSYGYESIGYTSSPPGEEIRNGLVFCRVDSWLTGRRMVSLPFSDHCEPLFNCCRGHGIFCCVLASRIEAARDGNTSRYVRSVKTFISGKANPASGRQGVITCTALTSGRIWTKFVEVLTKIRFCGGLAALCGPVSLKNPDDRRPYWKISTDFWWSLGRATICLHSPISGFRT